MTKFEIGKRYYIIKEPSKQNQHRQRIVAEIVDREEGKRNTWVTLRLPDKGKLIEKKTSIYTFKGRTECILLDGYEALYSKTIVVNTELRYSTDNLDQFMITNYLATKTIGCDMVQYCMSREFRNNLSHQKIREVAKKDNELNEGVVLQFHTFSEDFASNLMYVTFLVLRVGRE